MLIKAAQAIAATALALSLATVVAPAASAAPDVPATTADSIGSVGVCLNIPLWPSPLSFSLCV